MSFFDQLDFMNLRRASRASTAEQAELAQRNENFILFARTEGYKAHKAWLLNELAELDREEINDPGTAVRMQGERRALRRVIDHLEDREATVSIALRTNRAEFDEQVAS